MPFRDLPGVTQCRFQQGEYLISVGEQIDHVYYLVKGIVHREFLTVSGYESILSIKTGGSVVGALVGILLFYWPQNKGISDYNFIARTNCICYRVPKDVCMEYLRQHPDLLEDVVRTSMEEYARLLDLFQTKREGAAASRLCGFLLERSRDTEHGRILSKKYTNVEISKFLSVHKVTIARILGVLKEEGCIIRTVQGLQLLDIPTLEKYAYQHKPLNYQ